MSLKVTLDTMPEPPCHVLIRTPLLEFLMMESLTVMFVTQACEFPLPRLPMLQRETEYLVISRYIIWEISSHQTFVVKL